jgi:hypothetical protein
VNRIIGRFAENIHGENGSPRVLQLQGHEVATANGERTSTNKTISSISVLKCIRYF